MDDTRTYAASLIYRFGLHDKNVERFRQELIARDAEVREEKRREVVEAIERLKVQSSDHRTSGNQQAVDHNITIEVVLRLLVLQPPATKPSERAMRVATRFCKELGDGGLKARFDSFSLALLIDAEFGGSK